MPINIVLTPARIKTMIRLISAHGEPPIYLPIRSKALKIKIEIRLYQLPFGSLSPKKSYSESSAKPGKHVNVAMNT